MKRSTALILATFLDVFAAGIFYSAVYQPLIMVFSAITTRAEFIRYTTDFYIGFGCLVLPVIHLIGLIETYLPRLFNRTVCTRVICGSIIVFLLLGIGTAAMVKRAILHNGYFNCESANIHRKLLHIKVYVLNDDTCHQLTLERKKQKILGSR